VAEANDDGARGGVEVERAVEAEGGVPAAEERAAGGGVTVRGGERMVKVVALSEGAVVVEAKEVD
jgi:hypothetical protein